MHTFLTSHAPSSGRLPTMTTLVGGALTERMCGTDTVSVTATLPILAACRVEKYAHAIRHRPQKHASHGPGPPATAIVIVTGTVARYTCVANSSSARPPRSRRLFAPMEAVVARVMPVATVAAEAVDSMAASASTRWARMSEKLLAVHPLTQALSVRRTRQEYK